MVLVLALVMCAVVDLMYAQGPAGHGPGPGRLSGSDGRLAGGSLGAAQHRRKVRGDRCFAPVSCNQTTQTKSRVPY